VTLSLRSTAVRLVLNSFGSTGGFGLTCSQEATSRIVDRALPVSHKQLYIADAGNGQLDDADLSGTTPTLSICPMAALA
jgi:hypothetical protein